jgi:hypothetical protein
VNARDNLSVFKLAIPTLHLNRICRLLCCAQKKITAESQRYRCVSRHSTKIGFLGVESTYRRGVDKGIFEVGVSCEQLLVQETRVTDVAEKREIDLVGRWHVLERDCFEGHDGQKRGC